MNQQAMRQSGGRVGIPWVEFDKGWMQHFATLTRQLIDTENDHRHVRIAAVKAGCELSDREASSVFDNDRPEGYSPSWEEECAATAPSALIEEWLLRQPLRYDSIVENTTVDSPDTDRWQGPEPEPWESWSAHADPKTKTKIFKWQRACSSAENPGKRNSDKELGVVKA